MSEKASDLDWSLFDHFSASEWPDGTLEYMDANIIKVVSKLREELPDDYAMIPSPRKDAHVRHGYSGSRHSTKGTTRLSDATDIFMSWDHIWKAWATAVQINDIGGLGIYTDTRYGWKSMPMLHIDTRPSYPKVLWVRSKGQYIYYNSNPVEFFKALGEV